MATGYMTELNPIASRFVDDILIHARSRGGNGYAVTLRMARQVVRLRFSSDSLRSLFLPAFEHVCVGGDVEPDLHLHIIEGEPFPAPAWPAEAYRSCGEVIGFADDTTYLHVDIPLAALSVLNLNRGEGAYWVRSAAAVPSYERSAPFRALLHRWLMRHGMPLAHVGAVASGSNGALIMGAKGAGKSTTSLACLAAGMDFLADDRCALDCSTPEPMAWSVYSTAKVFAGEAGRFGILDLAEKGILPAMAGDEKMLAFMPQIAARQVRLQAPIRCIIEPKPLANRHSRFVALPAGQAARTLTSDLIGRSPATALPALVTIAKLCRTVPCYQLEASRDLREVASSIRELLDRGGMLPHSPR